MIGTSRYNESMITTPATTYITQASTWYVDFPNLLVRRLPRTPGFREDNAGIDGVVIACKSIEFSTNYDGTECLAITVLDGWPIRTGALLDHL
jgi:hypothetical protein